jgi:hypothetical protein
MSRIAFILGAGASQQAGAPLMADFLDVAHDLCRRGEARDASSEFEAVFSGISELQRVHSKAQLDIQNLESVFGAFEMARTVGRCGGLSPEQIERLAPSMRRVIVKTIELTIRLPVPEGRRVVPAPPYSSFARLLLGCQQVAPPLRASVLTFNYDISIDHALHFHGLPVDYALPSTGSTREVPLLKLHGSLNWARCAVCRAVVPWTLPEYFQRYSWGPFLDAGPVMIPIGTQIRDWQHCQQPVESEPILVPPTWSKTQYHAALSTVWSRAAQELADAESIFVFGFSLPPTDAFFSYLYALGCVGTVPLRRFWVFDPDSSGVVETRFRQLLGPGAAQRFQYFSRRFEDGIPVVARELGIDLGRI